MSRQWGLLRIVFPLCVNDVNDVKAISEGDGEVHSFAIRDREGAECDWWTKVASGYWDAVLWTIEIFHLSFQTPQRYRWWCSVMASIRSQLFPPCNVKSDLSPLWLGARVAEYGHTLPDFLNKALLSITQTFGVFKFSLSPNYASFGNDRSGYSRTTQFLKNHNWLAKYANVGQKQCSLFSPTNQD